MPPLSVPLKDNPHTGRKEDGRGEFHHFFGNDLPPDDPFCLVNILRRLLRVIVLFYIMMILHPCNFFLTIWKYEENMNGRLIGTFRSLFIPVYPFLTILDNSWNTLKEVLYGKVEDDWEAASIWCVPPEGVAEKVFSYTYGHLATTTGLFLLDGYEPIGINLWGCHTSDFHKQFYRSLLRSAGAQVPKEIATWNGERLVQKEEYTDQDVFIKLPDKLLGMGDAKLKFGEDIHSLRDIEDYMAVHYKGKKDVLVLEWVKPKEGLEAHSFSIVTAKVPTQTNDIPGQICATKRVHAEAVSMLYLGSFADGASTHSAHSMYVFDPDTEKVVGTASWCNPHLAKMSPDTSMFDNTCFTGIQTSVATAVRAHNELIQTHPHMSCIGWDLMLTNWGPVFFEGNFASIRFPHYMLLSWTHMLTALKIFYWNRGENHSKNLTDARYI